MLKTKNPKTLIGLHFHTLKSEQKWQGEVLALLRDGHYLVRVYEWENENLGYMIRIVKIDQMLGWTFYEDPDRMKECFSFIQKSIRAGSA